MAGEGGPFGAVIARSGMVVSEGWNRVTSTCDPTAHAEIVAIRAACQELDSFALSGCTLYASCEPCPMCLAAMYWARIDRYFYGNTRDDAAAIGFDDSAIYTEIALPIERRSLPGVRLLAGEARQVFEAWEAMPEKKPY